MVIGCEFSVISHQLSLKIKQPRTFPFPAATYRRTRAPISRLSDGWLSSVGRLNKPKLFVHQTSLNVWCHDPSFRIHDPRLPLSKNRCPSSALLCLALARLFVIFWMRHPQTTMFLARSTTELAPVVATSTSASLSRIHNIHLLSPPLPHHSFSVGGLLKVSRFTIHVTCYMFCATWWKASRPTRSHWSYWSSFQPANSWCRACWRCF